MNTERLRHLIEVMRRVERDEKPLEMYTWIDEAGLGPIDNKEELCKTAKCCLGWACFDDKFRAEGLDIEMQYCRLADWEQHSRPVGWVPTYRGAEGFCAGEAFFDITTSESNYIFNPHRYDDEDEITPQDVIDHIYDVIEGNVPDKDEDDL
jgi:hypothetical protein